MLCSPPTPYADKLAGLLAGMRLNVKGLERCRQAAAGRGLTPGRLVRLVVGDELGLLTGFNDEDISFYPGHEYPLVVRTTLGELMYRLEDVQLFDGDHARAVLEDGSEVDVRLAQSGTDWVLQDATGKVHCWDDLLTLEDSRS
ncbi:hypothetical protein D3C71_21570 [compost metagenome]